MDETFTKELRNAKTVEEFINVIDLAEAEKDARDAEKESDESLKVSKTGEVKTDTKVSEQNNNGKLILAVTGCPTGIAHTYMAAESLEKRQKNWAVVLR